MERDPTADACLTNGDVDRAAGIIANLKARLDEAEAKLADAERIKFETAAMLVIAAGGRIQVNPRDMADVHSYELRQFNFVQNGAIVFTARRK